MRLARMGSLNSITYLTRTMIIDSELIDSHAHLTSSQFSEAERMDVLTRSYNARISTILNISTNRRELDEAFALTEIPHPCTILYAASTTPHEASFEDSFFEYIAEMAYAKRIQAIGETGLDYFYEHSPKEEQRFCLERYLNLAIKTNLPVVIHCREAFSDFISILDQFDRKVRGVLHCFTGTKEDARALVDRGFYISFSGIVTYPKSESLREVLKEVPIERLLLETDAPYLAPQGFRGKRCEPSMIAKTYQLVSEMLYIQQSVLEKQIAKNFSAFLSH